VRKMDRRFTGNFESATFFGRPTWLLRGSGERGFESSTTTTTVTTTTTETTTTTVTRCPKCRTSNKFLKYLKCRHFKTLRNYIPRLTAHRRC
jgi:hypothetical protein